MELNAPPSRSVIGTSTPSPLKHHGRSRGPRGTGSLSWGKNTLSSHGIQTTIALYSVAQEMWLRAPSLVPFRLQSPLGWNLHLVQP